MTTKTSAPDPAPARPAKQQPPREATDDSLRTERVAADGLDVTRTVERDADLVVDLARARADAVLDEAREKADGGASAEGDVVRARADADDVLEDERASADENLRRERAYSARILSAMLPLARGGTDRKLLTERADSDAKLSSRDDFLGMVSHDLNNLLGGIILTAGTLERRATARGDAETPEAKRIATRASSILLYAARMKRLIGDLVDVTSLSAGKLAVKVAPSDARALILEALEPFRPLAAEKRLSLEAVVKEDAMPVLCDHGRILQVIANLVGNAVKFTAGGGHISVGAVGQGEGAQFSVTDSGPGIPGHLLDSVFVRFWQAGDDDRRGLGLGLYIAKSIVDAHGGRIWVESTVGEGSTFHFTLPSRENILAQAQDPPPTPSDDATAAR